MAHLGWQSAKLRCSLSAARVGWKTDGFPLNRTFKGEARKISAIQMKNRI
jgi:hypothetical protein